MNQSYQLPNFSFEKHFWNRGYKLVAGLDEVGRGSFAGPAVVACVVFDREVSPRKIKIDDSKRLTAKQREEADRWIKEKAHHWKIEEVPVKHVNKSGIHKSIHSGFRRVITSSVKSNDCRVDYLLIDGFNVPYFRGYHSIHKSVNHIDEYSHSGEKQLAIKGGDRKSISIAAASIIAKVYRDSLMKNLGRHDKYSKYCWYSNKGYGTAVHRQAILKHGASDLHRKQFIKTFLKNNS